MRETFMKKALSQRDSNSPPTAPAISSPTSAAPSIGGGPQSHVLDSTPRTFVLVKTQHQRPSVPSGMMHLESSPLSSPSFLQTYDEAMRIKREMNKRDFI